MKIKWTESNRISELVFLDIEDFADWLSEQALNGGEIIEIIEGDN